MRFLYCLLFGHNYKLIMGGWWAKGEYCGYSADRWECSMCKKCAY